MGRQQKIFGTFCSVVNLECNVFIAASQYVVHQVFDPERSVYESMEGLKPLHRRLQRRTTAEHRQIHQKPRLLVHTVFLHQPHFSAQRRFSCFDRPHHRFVTNRFGKHVVSECPLIAHIERFEIDDRGVVIALAVGADRVVRVPLGTDPPYVFIQLCRRDHFGEPDPLNSGKFFSNLKIRYKKTPFVPVQLL